MLEKWGLRAMIAIVAAVGLFVVLAFTLQVPAVGKTIGSAQACGTCHVMTHEVITLEKSAHRDLACLECHAAGGFLEKPIEEIKSASVHMYVFMTGAPDVIKPTETSRKIAQENCIRCHAGLNDKVHTKADSERFCFECHRATPHGTPRRN